MTTVRTATARRAVTVRTAYVKRGVILLAALLLLGVDFELAGSRPNPVDADAAGAVQIADNGGRLSAALLPEASPSSPPSPSSSPTPKASAAPAHKATKPAAATHSPAKSGSNRTIAVATGFGVAAGSALLTLSDGDLNSRLDGIAGLGVHRVRFDIEWSNVGWAGPGKYDWKDPDRVVRAVVAHGLAPLVILDYTPTWARSPECADTPVCRPRDPAQFGVFAKAAATRYAPKGVHDWEIWNEPNLQQFYAPKPDPAGYASLLKAAYPAITSVDSGATVVTGGTAPTQTAADGSTIEAPRFLSQVYGAGAKGYFDAVGHHPYTFPYTPVHAYPGGAWSELSSLHSIMAANGDGGKKIWATEYGAPTGGPGIAVVVDKRKAYPGSPHVSESLQAEIATVAIKRYKQLAGVGPLFWYSYQDSGSDSSSIENFFGLVRADGSHKPAYDAFKSAIG